MSEVEVLIGGTLVGRATPCKDMERALSRGVDVVVTVDDLVVLAGPASASGQAFVDVFLGNAIQTRWLIVDPDRSPDGFTVDHRTAAMILRRVSRQGLIPPKLARLMRWRPL